MRIEKSKGVCSRVCCRIMDLICGLGIRTPKSRAPKPVRLCLCVCVRVCVCVCVYGCVYAYMYVCVHIYLYIYISLSLYIYIYVCVYICIYIYEYKQLSTYVCIYIYIYPSFVNQDIPSNEPNLGLTEKSSAGELAKTGIGPTRNGCAETDRNLH